MASGMKQFIIIIISLFFHYEYQTIFFEGEWREGKERKGKERKEKEK